MPGKGFVHKTDGQFCARLGITEALPRGNDWRCQAMTETLSDLSCGVTGCFAIINATLHFRQGVTSNNPTGTDWVSVGSPEYETFVKVEAGPIYELWAISVDWLPYRRLGMKDDVPMGTAWKLVPEVYLKDVTLGIYGPIGIYGFGKSLLMILNGW